MGWLKNIFRNPVIKLKKISPEDIGKRTSKEIRHATEEEFKRKVMPREAKEILNEIERIVQPFDKICTVANDLYKHPFMPRFYGTPDNISFVIDFIDDCTLDSIKQLHLDTFEKNIIIMEIMLTIQYFHSQKCIYRDLKPNNVIIDQNKNGIIIDLDRMIPDFERKRKDKTVDFGSNYIAPEVVSMEQFSTKADIYSVGKLIYYIFKEEKPKSSHPNLFEPELFEISEIIEDCTKEEPSERPEISELMVKMMKYFLKNIKEYEKNNFLMEKYLRIIEKCNISEQVKKELDNVYSMISNISSIFNNFQQSFKKHDIKVKNQYLQEILYKFNFYYYDDNNEQEEKYPEFQKESNVIVIDECEVYKSKYSIICFNYKLIIIKENIKSETHFINDFISKQNESEIFYLKDGNQEFLDEISTFSKHFQIDNNEFRSLFNLIIRCIISFLLKKSYNDRETKHYEEDDKIIISNDIPDESFIIIREEVFEQMKETSLIYYIPREEIMIMKRAYESEEDKEREKYNTINIPLMNRYYGYIVREEYKKYYLFEYTKGETLDKYDKNKLTYNEKCNIILKIMLTIGYFKSKGIVYEYLFPNNIIIDKDKEPILKHYEISAKHFENLSPPKENITQTNIYYLGNLIYYLSHNDTECIHKSNECLIMDKCFELIKTFYQENYSQIHDMIVIENDKNANFYLGSIYYEGLYVTSDIDKAIHCFKEASCFDHSSAKNNLGIIYKTGKGVSANPYNSVIYFEEAIRQKGDAVAMFNLAHLHLYKEIHNSDLSKAIELLVKSAINEIEFSLDLLCLAVIEKYEALNISEIEKDFEKIDKERGSKLAKRVYVKIKFQFTHDPAYYEKTYNKLKGINLVYYGEKIEYQTEKKKIEYIDKRPKINKLFYEGLGDI
ncbi:positive regulation of sphingomyelin catabolic process [Tritrichomonas musculus]|uniref:Positive regulation of sphingomyelin catabolic process n=1 Tax=Tritrichomonas musculus TaxID=1915356 RepID=A0ABR2JFV2_9EUKA